MTLRRLYCLCAVAQIVAKLKAHVKARSLSPDAVLFARRAGAPVPLRVVAEPGTLGFTEPNEAGR